jgi:hypothetical protein
MASVINSEGHIYEGSTVAVPHEFVGRMVDNTNQCAGDASIVTMPQW